MGMKNLLKKSWLITMSLLLLGFVSQVSAQCERTSAYGTVTAGAPGALVTISTCNYTSEYSTVNGLVSGTTYYFACTLSGVHKYVTLRTASTGGTVLAHGSSPLTYNSTVSGTVYAHWSDNAACASTSSCHVTTVETALTTPPSCATLNAPVHGATGVSPTVSLTWAASLGTTGYYLYVGTDSLPTNYINGTSLGAVTTYQVTGLSNNQTYYWRVVPFNANGSATGCGANKFTTVACPAPTSLNTSAISPNTASLGWTPSGTSVDFDIEILPSTGTATGTPTYSGVTSPYLASGLTASTSYQWYVRANCGGGLNSVWVGPNTFTTACDAFMAPFSETFDGSTMPACWSQSATAGGPWVFTGTPGYAAATAGDHTGNGGYFTWLDFSTPYDYGVKLVSPIVDVSLLSSPFLAFYFYSHNTNNADVNTLFVEAWNGTMWAQVDSIQEDNGGWTEYSYDLANFTYGADLVQFRFRGESCGCSNTYYNDFLIDDVSIFDNSTAPVCGSLIAPADSADNRPTDLTLTWGAASAVTGYYLSLGTNNPPTSIYNMMNVGNVLSYAVTALDYSTDYYWQVTPYNANGSATGCEVAMFTTMGMPSGAACDYTIELYDDYGDGWNGGLLTISVGGIPVLTDITIVSGGFESYSFSVNDGMEITYSYTAGSWSTENEYHIFDADGIEFFASGVGGVAPGANGSAGFGVCPSCDYTIELYDDWGDGWNGGTMDVLIDGNVALDDITLGSGASFGSFTFNVYSGSEITTIYTAGSYPYENSYTIIDANGTFVFSDGDNGNEPLATGNAGYTDCSALPPILGCTDPIALNYMDTATQDDGSCLYINGCTDPFALNYMDTATFDDGSCIYPGDICEEAFDYGLINSPLVAGSTINAYGEAWYSFTLFMDYSNVAVSLCGSAFDTKLAVWDSCTATSYIAYNDDAYSVCGSGGNSHITIPYLAAGTYYAQIYGYSTYFGDYNLEITGTGGIGGCTDPLAENYDSLATIDDGSCTYILGCTDPLAINYMDTATFDDGSCYHMGDSCSLALDYGFINDPIISSATTKAYDVEWYTFTLDADYFDVAVSLCGSSFDTKLEIYDVCGGTQIGYNDDYCGTRSQIDFAFLEAGTYVAKVYAYSSYYGNFDLNISGTIYLPGCTVATAINYDAQATFEDGSCYYMGDSCGLALNYGFINDPMVSSSLLAANDVEWYSVTLNDDYMNVMVSLCGSAFDTKLEVYDACGGTMLGQNNDFCALQSQVDFAFAPAGTYFVKVFGNGAAYGNFNLTITGTLVIYGCIDVNALNYNPLANMSDGTCEYPLWNAGVNAIVSPVSGAFLYSPQAVTLEIENYGQNALYNFPIGFILDGGTPVIETFTDTLPAGASINYTFSTTADISVGGLHTITGFTNVTDDYDPTNDELTVTIDNFVGCFYTLKLMDEYGDGWNGGWLNVKINNVDYYASLTLANGATGLFDVPVYTGDVIAVTYHQGQFASENSYAFLDGFGNQIYVDGLVGIPTPTTHTTTATCSAVVYGCTDPSALNYVLAANVDNGSCEYMGESCATTLDYGFINDPAELGSINMDKAMWYTFTLTEDYVDVEVSLCGSSFNTMLEVMDMCNGTQLGMNDDYCGTQSQVDFGTLAAGTYYAKIYAGAGISGDFMLEITGTPYSQTLPQLPWTYFISGTNHTILVPQTVTIDLAGSPAQAGDFIGVFFLNNGVYICGGYAIWEGVTTSVAAWGDDNQTTFKDGFVDGEDFVWKVWQASTGLVFDAVATYQIGFPNEGQYITNGMSGLISLGGSIVDYQQISIPLGWSIISTYISPTDATCASVFNGIESFIEIVKNDGGSVYWPLYSVNTIGSLVIGEGYHIKTNTASILELSGTAVEPELTPISLDAGWNTFAYLRNSMAPIATMLSGINADIAIVKDGFGNVYWPQYGIDMVINMIPGQGYQGNMLNATTLTYTANGPMAPSKSSLTTTLRKFTQVCNTGENMTVGIPQNVWENTPAIGDEVGIFSSNGTLIGAGVYTGGNIAISVWGDDEYSAQVDGMVSGQMFSLKLWNSTTGEVSNLDISWKTGSNVYATNDIAVAGKVSTNLAPLSYALGQNIPNPFKHVTKIGFEIPEDAHLSISVYNLLGEKLQDVVSGNYSAGQHSVDFDATGLASGTYFYKIMSDNFVATKSMIVE